MFPRNQGVIRGSESTDNDPFESSHKEKRVGARTSTFQSHILKSSSAADIFDAPPPCPPRRTGGLARSATTANANLRNGLNSLNESVAAKTTAPMSHPRNLIEL